MITSEDDVRESEEWEEDMVTTIMAETKKTLARARRLKEMKVMSPGLIRFLITHEREGLYFSSFGYNRPYDSQEQN